MADLPDHGKAGSYCYAERGSNSIDDPDRHHYYLVHAADDCLCDWKPEAKELDMLQQSLHITYVEGSARWMGSCKHNYWDWLHCQLPQGQVSLTDLKLTHPSLFLTEIGSLRLCGWPPGFALKPS